jgi:cellulose synthase (UDP-forming)
MLHPAAARSRTGAGAARRPHWGRTARPASAYRVRSDALLAGPRRWQYAALWVTWLVANGAFWPWWLQPQRVGDGWLYALFTAAFAYEAVLLPTAYLFFLGRMRRPRPIPAPPGLRVALITLCVPARESLDVIERQLAALADVRYPHESWVLDEGDDPAVRAAAARHGVRYFTRRGVDGYNQDRPPFKARTKAGNVNAWLHAHGHAYDYFVQFDVDHRPRPDYLEAVLGYFRDPGVAWVQAPSVYGNLDNWVARGAAEQELVLQGPLQQGFFGHSETPFIIGSHCTYRTRAVLEIGGFQPTRAEDHLDTVVLAARGYRGVFVPDVLALGSGPDTFETYLRQQFAWALSMVQVLLDHTPRLLGRYRPRQALQFLFAQTWYPLWSASMLVLFALPLLALATGRRPADVSLLDFGARSLPLTLVALGVWWWSRRWQLPAGLGLSWRGLVLHIARWPIVFWAVLNAVLRVRHPYMITPKGGSGGLPRFSLRSQAIYLAGAWAGVAVSCAYLLRGGAPAVQGYLLFALLGVGYLLLVVLTNVAADLAALRRLAVGPVSALRLRAGPLAVVLLTLGAVAATAALSDGRVREAAVWTGPAGPAQEATGAPAAHRLLEAAARQAAAGARTSPETVTAPRPRSPEGVPAGASGAPEPPEPPEPPWAPSGPPARLELPGEGQGLLAGAYDPWQRLTGLGLGLEHWFVRQDEPDLLAGALARARGRATPLVTIEPYPPGGRPGPVLGRVAAGEADGELRRLARVVRASGPQEVWVRWGHEMDLPGLYPWSVDDPALYREAFRRVVAVFREEGATNARFVWSPAGETGGTPSAAYYPGDDVVDLVGLTVLGDAGWDEQFGLPRRSLADVLRPRYDSLAPLGKPILIAELGVSGPPEEQAAWIAAGAAALPEFPAVRAAVYFNDRNAPNNRLPEQPDWRVSAEALRPLLG